MSEGEIGNACHRHIVRTGNEGVFVDPSGPHESAGMLAPTGGYADLVWWGVDARSGTLHVCKHCGSVYWVGA